MKKTPTAWIAASPSAASTPENQEPNHGESAGWDPYEVWRTRVLLPRLQESAAAEQPKKAEPLMKPYLLRTP